MTEEGAPEVSELGSETDTRMTDGQFGIYIQSGIRVGYNTCQTVSVEGVT